MGLEMGIWLIIGIGLAYLASRLLATKQPKPTNDQKPSTTSERGTFIPWVLGKRRVGPVIGWVGDRSTTKEEPEGAGGGKKDDTPKVTIYHEGGWHILNCKPSYALTRIYQAGKIIFEGPITYTSHPTGSLVDLGKEGKFYIYWGDQDASKRNSYLNGFVGVDSCWPSCMYIVWAKKRLGPSAHWPQIEYEIDARPTNTVLSQTAAVLGQGLNPAHCVAEALFAAWPNGLNLNQDNWDLDSLEDAGLEAVDDSTHASFISVDGEEVSGIIGGFLQDYGYMLPISQLNGKLTFVPIREPQGTIKEIKEEMLIQPTEIITNHGERPTDQMIFMFPDRKHRYKDMTIQVAADGQADYLQHSRARRIGLRTVVDFDPAAVLAERRGQEERAGGATIKIKANHAARTLEPGEPIICHGIDEILRVTSVKVQPKSGKVDVTCMTDFYAAKKSDFVTNEGGGELTFQAPAEDLAKGFVEIPEELLGGVKIIYAMALKIRAHNQITSSGIWLKLAADSDYTYIGLTSAVITGGLLLEALPASGEYNIAQGPLIDDKGPDIATVTDQTETNWRLGRQIMVINQEIMFLDELTAVGGDFRLDGILRGRYGTEIQAHSVDDPVFIFSYDVINAFTDALFSVGAVLDIILQPNSGAGSVDFSTLTKITHNMKGKGIIPLRVPNLRVTAPRHMVEAYMTGEDITFKWSYMSSLSPGTGAGSQGYGTPVGSADIDGEFLLEIWNSSDTVIVRQINTTDLTYTYTNTNLQTDHSGEPASFPVRISALRGGYQSEKTTITITKET